MAIALFSEKLFKLSKKLAKNFISIKIAKDLC
jgi:hypothetical protein